MLSKSNRSSLFNVQLLMLQSMLLLFLLLLLVLLLLVLLPMRSSSGDAAFCRYVAGARAPTYERAQGYEGNLLFRCTLGCKHGP